MSYRDNFSSDMKSPGNYAGNTTYGNSGYKGGYGGTNNPGLGYTTPAQRNFAAQGGSFGRGFGFGSLGASENNLGKGPWPGGYATPVLQGQVPPVRPRMPVPTSLPPAVTQEDIPGVVQPEPAPQGIPWSPQRYVNPGYGMDPNGIGRTVTPRTAPRGYFGPSQPTYSRNGQGYVSNAGGYGGATYAGMGSDFRSIDSW